MANFDYYKKFILKELKSDSNIHHNFFSVDKEDIDEAEAELGFRIPKQLVEFYEQIGYGFMFTEKKNSINTLLYPETIVDIYLRREQFEGDPDLEIYDDNTKIIFYQVNEGVYILMNISNDNTNIYYFGKTIADSLEDFMNKLEKDSAYFEKLVV